MQTWFASAERAEPEVLAQDVVQVAESDLFHVLLKAWHGYVIVLNEHRQVLAINPALLRDLGTPVLASLLGRRLGELVGCRHAWEGPGGCGTGHACSDCGAMLTILDALERQEPVEGTCHIARESGSLHLAVRATPVQEDGRDYLVVGMHDMSDSMHRQALERTFFHYMRNTLAGLVGWSELLAVECDKDDSSRVARLALRLSDEIEAHRLLLEAESGSLRARRSPVAVAELFSQLRDQFPTQSHRLDLEQPQGVVTTDRVLLLRVLGNMTKNALEATREDQQVRVHYYASPRPVFEVSNPGGIPVATACRLFERGYSTKGAHGRGLGTWAMKLLGEQVLGGKVSFACAQGTTTFRVELPAY